MWLYYSSVVKYSLAIAIYSFTDCGYFLFSCYNYASGQFKCLLGYNNQLQRAELVTKAGKLKLACANISDVKFPL